MTQKKNPRDGSDQKPKGGKRKPSVRTDLPDDDAIRQLFPKRVVTRVNKEIEHEPGGKPSSDKE